MSNASVRPRDKSPSASKSLWLWGAGAAGAAAFNAVRARRARLAESPPQAELLIVEGAGHMVHHTACDAVTSAIRRAVTAA